MVVWLSGMSVCVFGEWQNLLWNHESQYLQFPLISHHKFVYNKRKIMSFIIVFSLSLSLSMPLSAHSFSLWFLLFIQQSHGDQHNLLNKYRNTFFDSFNIILLSSKWYACPFFIYTQRIAALCLMYTHTHASIHIRIYIRFVHPICK